MKPTPRDQQETEKTDFFDPFWMLFADDDYEDVETDEVERSKRRSSGGEDRNGTSVFDYFGEDGNDTLLEKLEERDPRENCGRDERVAATKKHHYWRRNQAKKGGGQRGTFGRKNSSRRNLFPASNAAKEVSAQREVPDVSVTDRRGRTALASDHHNNGELFPEQTIPTRVLDAFTVGWDVWGEQDSSSDCSGDSYLSEDSKNVNCNSVDSCSNGTRGFEGGVKEVQQILIQFNPTPPRLQSSKAAVVDVEPKNLPVPLRQHEGMEAVRLPDVEDTTTKFGNANGTRDCHGNPERLNTTRLNVGILEDKEPSNCFALSKSCGTGKWKDIHRGFPFGREKSTGQLDQKDLSAVFPRLRMVADEKDSGGKTAIVANSSGFNYHIPAHLQISSDAFLATKGPQSLYEYEYDGGEHIDVAYNHFGSNPLSLLVIRHHHTPPRSGDHGAVVQVEASTISMTDCSMRAGEWMGKDTPPLPITPGVDMVGKIFRIDSDTSSRLGLCVGDRVMSLTRCGGNSRFLSIDPRQLVKIAEDVDPAEAACLTETYLSAFQVLHFGQGAGVRYKTKALKGKSILILGTIATTLGHALVELASVAGAAKIIATSAPRHFPHLRSLGIIPVSVDPALWYDQLNEEIDLVLVSDPREAVVAEHFRVLNESGHLIVVGQRLGSGMPIGEWEGELRSKSLVCKRQKSRASMIDRTHDYNLFRQWEHELEKCKRDLGHLVKLLAMGAIKPNVLDRIPLNKVAKAQDMVESERHPGGFLVCEPWLRNKKRAVRL